MIGEQVILEKLVLDDPIIREAAAREDLGIVILFNGPLGEFRYKDGAAEQLQTILNDLAAESGYGEVADAPLLPVGHSGAGIYCWNVAYWNPGRTFGVVTLHSAAILPPAWDPKATADGVPVLAVSGEYESWGNPAEPLDKHWRWLRGGLLNMRSCFDESLTSELVQPGAGHFSWDEPLARHVAMFIEKAAHYRIPAGGESPATQAAEATRPEISPATQATESPATRGVAATRPSKLRHLALESGWLTDVTLLTPSRYPPAPYGQYASDPTLALWHMDEPLARAAETFDDRYKHKTDQRVTFVQDGKPLPAQWIEPLKFEPVGDGMTIKVAADFLTETPEGVAGAGKPLGHAAGPIRFRLIGGWGGGGEQTGPDTFRIRFDHFGINRRTCNMQVMAYHEGDDRYAYAEQPCQLTFPEKNTAGTPQRITFPKIEDVAPGTTDVPLKATSDSGLPVEYYVREGPAEVHGDHLTLTPVPPRAKLPVKLTVVAYQWGRGIDPPVQSAPPVEQTIWAGGNPKPETRMTNK